MLQQICGMETWLGTWQSQISTEGVQKSCTMSSGAAPGHLLIISSSFFSSFLGSLEAEGAHCPAPSGSCTNSAGSGVSPPPAHHFGDKSGVIWLCIVLTWCFPGSEFAKGRDGL